MTLIKIAKRNQVTLPSSFCKTLSLVPGTVLDGTVSNTRLVLRKPIEDTPVDLKIRLRDRYQITLPPAFCRGLWVSCSHMLEVELNGETLCLTPKAVIEAPSPKRLKQDVTKPRESDAFQSEGLADLAKRSSRRKLRGR